MQFVQQMRRMLTSPAGKTLAAAALVNTLETAAPPDTSAADLDPVSRPVSTLADLKLPAPEPAAVNATCGTFGYRALGGVLGLSAQIPDGDGTSYTAPLIRDNAGVASALIGEVIVDVYIDHPAIGDLIFELGCDEARNGNIVWKKTLWRPGVTAQDPEGFGCEWDLSHDQPISFSSAAPEYLGVDGSGNCVPTTNPIASDCFLPTGWFAEPLDFRNFHQHGDWYLRITDAAQVERGTFFGWKLYVSDQATVGVAPASAPQVALSIGPNPARSGISTISFSLAQPEERAQVVIFDPAGRPVRHLLPAGALSSGPHHFAWDGKDDQGAVASSGVYFARLFTPGWISAKKLVVCR